MAPLIICPIESKRFFSNDAISDTSFLAMFNVP
jgi:hypothetical protein